jgi:DNA-directed RNA polymerase specialized sigma24 family protein
MSRHIVNSSWRGKVLPFRGGGQSGDDLDLLARIGRGDNGSLRDLFYQHGDRIYRIFRYECGFSRATAAEAVRDAFLRVWRSAERFDDGCSAVGWLVRAALNANELDWSLHEAPTEPRPPGDAGLATIDEPPEQTPEVFTDLEASLAALPWRPRIATALLERESMTENEIADALAVPTRVVWRWVSIGRMALAPLSEARRLLDLPTRVGRALRSGRWCPPSWKLNRTVSTELDRKTGWHISGCAECAVHHAILVRVSIRLSDLPRREMSPAARDDVAVSLLAAPVEADRSEL